MRTSCSLLIVLVTSFVASANASYVDYMWADSVESWTGNIINFSGERMTKNTTSWLTGLPDADQSDPLNGYAWDAEDLDSVAGWKMPPANETITVKFNTLIQDGEGDDVVVVGYRGPGHECSVQASSDGLTFTELGRIGNGSPGNLTDSWFDLNGLSDIQYVRIERVSTAPFSAGFIDAIGAVPVPEPGSALVLLSGCVFVVSGRLRRKAG